MLKLFPRHRLSLQRAAIPQLNERLTRRSCTMQHTNEGQKVLHSTNPTTAPSKDVYSLKINSSRLMNSLHESCEYGKAHPYGT